MRRFRKVLQITVKIVAGILLLFLVLWGLIQIPLIQSYLVQRISSKFADQLHTEIRVESVDLKFFKTIFLNNVVIEDQHRDTLLVVEGLGANISLFSFFKKEIILKEIYLENAASNIHTLSNSDSLNIQFLIDAFDPKLKKSDSQQSPWAIDILGLRLENVQFNYKHGAYSLKTVIPRFEVKSKHLDFNQKILDVEELTLDNSITDIELFSLDVLEDQGSTEAYNFPATGWQILANEVTLNNNQIFILKHDDSGIKSQADQTQFGFGQVNLLLKDLVFSDSLISSQIRNVSFLEEGGLSMNALVGDLAISPKHVSMENLSIQTDRSDMQVDVNMMFSHAKEIETTWNKMEGVIEFKKSSISTDELKRLLGDSWPEYLTQKEDIEVTGDIILRPEQFYTHEFEINLPGDQKVVLSGSVGDLQGVGKINLDIKQFRSSFDGLKSLSPGLPIPDYMALLGPFQMNGKVEGTFDELYVQSFKLNTQSPNYVDANFNIKHPRDFKNSLFSVDFNRLSLAPDLLIAISGNQPTPIFDSLGVIHFSGKMSGSLLDLHVIGGLEAVPGRLQSNLKISFDDQYQNADYEVSLDLNSWDMSRINENIPVEANGELSLKGSGLSLDNLDITYEGKLNTLKAKGYEYRDVSFAGIWQGRTVNISGEVADENLRTIFEANTLLDDSLPKLKFIAQTDTLNFHQLNLSQAPLAWSGNLELDMVGDALDEIEGSFQMENWRLSNDTSTLQSESLHLDSKRINGGRELHLESEFVSGNIQGDFQLSKLPEIGLQFINTYFPIIRSSETNDSSDAEINLGDKIFSFDIKTKDCTEMLKMVDSKWVSWNPSSLNGHFDGSKSKVEINGTFPGLGWGQIVVDSLLISVNSNRDGLHSEMRIKNLQADSLLISETLYQMDVANKALSFDLDMKKEQEHILTLAGSAKSLAESYVLNLHEEVFIMDSLWSVNPENYFEWDQTALKISGFNMTKLPQSVMVRTLPGSPRHEQGDLEIQFDNFSLALLPNIIDYSGNAFGGLANGDLQISGLFSRPVFQGELDIIDLKVNDKLLGNLTFKAEQEPTNEDLNFWINLIGDDNEVYGTGVYNLNKKSTNLDIDINQLKASLAEIVAANRIEQTSGELSGQLNLQLDASSVVLNGGLKVEQIRTLLKIAEEQYHIPEGQIVFSENRIDLGQFIVKDEAERMLEVQGLVKHQNFQNLELDIQFKSDEIQVLNTDNRSEVPFYGSLLVNTSGTVSGLLDQLQIKLDATTLPGSKLTVLPTEPEGVVFGDHVIFFGHPDSLSSSKQIEVKTEISNPYNFNLSANLEITPQAQLVIELDPDSGDRLVCNGGANLVVQMSPNGSVEVIGDYIFEEGKYNFSYEGLVKKEFEIQKGSSLIFPGDPRKAGFGLTTVYRTKTTTAALIENQSTLSDDELKEARRSTEVLVLMHIEGDLEEPQLNFEIKIPEMEEGRIGNTVSRRLVQLNENQAELNKQVFGLLFFNSFFVSQEGVATESLSNSIESAAFASLRGFMTSQLNNLASKYVKGFEIEFAMDTYSSGAIEGSTEVISEFGVSVSKQLFDDRLSMQVGSNFNMVRDDVTSWSNSDFTSLAGDFILEYKLTKEGNYLLRVFHLSDYDILEDENDYETGIGFVLKKKLKKKKK